MNGYKFTSCIVFSLIFSFSLSAQVFIDWNSGWSFFKGISEPSQPVSVWKDTGFNASGWDVGNAPFRYGDGIGGTLLADMQGNYSSLFLRKEFIVDDPDQFDMVRCWVDYDDGFALWINGELILQENTPAILAYDQFAPDNHESGEFEIFTLLKEDINLVAGTNIIAIQGFNVSTGSSDFYLDVKLEGVESLPETDAVVFNRTSGFYDNTFTATLSSLETGDTIRYTLDGSDPRYSITGLTGYSPIEVFIDPSSTIGERGTTGGVVLRASKFKTGYEPGKPITRNYVFLKEVIYQTHPGGSWPTSNINNQVIDLQMDTRITNHIAYKDLMDDALLDIPSVFISTDPANLFDPQTGIYVNAKYHGRTWERSANLELVFPDGRPGFNLDAGLRIRGGWSRHPEFAKHAFRLFFRTEYGEGKLRYPLFGNEGADRFDKIDFRTSQNYSWSKGGSEGKHNTMNRDVFSRDTQRDMGHPYTRSRYYHLYINGLYWGLFQSQERAEADYAETYFGGSSDDYDVIKVDIGDDWNLYNIEATDGNTDGWMEIWNMCQAGFASDASYFNLIGMNAAGEADTTRTVWVDIDNLIDYMLIIFYGGNFDAPVSKFSSNYNPNNFFAIKNRTRKREGFKFMIHDAEHTLLTDPVGPGVGIDENRVNIGNISWGRMNVTQFEKFHPQWLHHRLTENKEYRTRFADRVYRHFFNNGVFTPDSSIVRFKKTSDQLDLAIIAESARWGDMHVSTPRTKNSDWIPAVDKIINDYFPYRTEIVLNQLLDENLYVTVKPPVVKNTGGEKLSLKPIRISEDYTIILENPNAYGSVYYTLDGTDPRAVEGALSNKAIAALPSDLINIPAGSILKTRVRYVNLWSPMHEIHFQDASLFEKLKVTELYYNPMDEGLIDGQDLEFIELKNTGKTPLDLSGLAFTEGIYFTFPEGIAIDPGEFVVVASNREAFNGFYALPTDFEYTGRLSNSGEEIILKTADDEVVIGFTYSDAAPWPIEADGGGYSLVSAQINPTGDPNSVEYWTTSRYISGSPYADDEASQVLVGLQQLIENKQPTIIDLNEVFSETYGNNLIYIAISDIPGMVEATVNGNLLSLKPIKKGGAKIQLIISDGINVPFSQTFRVLVYPAPHSFTNGEYVFNQWSVTEPEFSFPSSMIFLQTDVSDPGLNYPLLLPYYIPHNDYHANDQSNIGFPYACTGRSRLNALGEYGISFINTGRQRDLGGALLALDTRGLSNLQLDWTAGTNLQNQRVYAIRLKYRTSLSEDFSDLIINGEVQEYITHTDGHNMTFESVDMPQSLLGKEYLQLLWKYYHVSGTSGPRAELRLDDIRIGTTVGTTEEYINSIQIYSALGNVIINTEDSAPAMVRVYNLMGQELINASIEHAGRHTINTNLPAGIYVVRVESKTERVSKKVFISKW